ncbi:MAG: VIT domain-containing protein, partial [Rhodospirillales bacterium]
MIAILSRPSLSTSLASITFAVAAFLSPEAYAEPEPRPGLPATAIDSGGLFLPGTAKGTVEAAPLLETDIAVSVSGLVARYRIRHIFANPTADWTEALYSYPLPDDAAVDALRMTIGDRLIEGEIQEKQEARKTYEAAR